ncbi:MAG: alpha-L-fucosidase [Isosphaeraceae bacterium]
MVASEGKRPQRRWLKRLAMTMVVVVAVPLMWAVASWTYDTLDARKARMTTTGPFRAELASLNRHRVPAWFEDAKFGIFVHWGLFSVPGFAPTTPFADVLRSDYDRAMVVSPFAEDYANAMRDPASPTAAYHREHHGDMPYQAFRATFEEQARSWNADRWAEQFEKAGAKYVVLVVKYHDGYSLWPTRVTNPHAPDWHSERDLVGELAEAVRRRGVRFGIYYSGGVDWTFQRERVDTLGDYSAAPYGDGYADYAETQLRELIARYKPDILWNDISWPTGQHRLNAILADYYNQVPDGVVNDRWSCDSLGRRAMGLRPVRSGFDLLMKLAIHQRPELVDSITPPTVPHADFTTPEYTQYDTTQAKKWETTRGMGTSYGYNRMETDAHYASFEQVLFPSFIDAVAKNGNYLLNVGPAGGQGTIPPEQADRLVRFGDWLAANGAAVYGSRPYVPAEARTIEGWPVKLTRSADACNVIVVGRPSGRTLTIEGLELPRTSGRLIASGDRVGIHSAGGRTVLSFESDLEGIFSPVIVVPTR